MGSNNKVQVAQGHTSGLKAVLLHKLHLVARQPVTQMGIDSSFARCDNITLDS